MKLIKRWQLNKSTFEQDDYIWLKRYSHWVDVKSDIQTYDVFPGRQIQVAGKSEIYIQTATQEQQDMLQLKYGDILFLLSQTWVGEGQIIQDAYGIITLDR